MTIDQFGDSGQLDSIGRLRVSNPHTLFDSKQIFDNQPLFWDNLLESGSGITAPQADITASSVITSTANTAGVFTRQTFMRFNYQPGKSQQVLMTGILAVDTGGTGVIRRIGQFDDDDGLFFQDNEGVISVVRRSNTSGSPVDDVVNQEDWNCDRLDGTPGQNPSGITIGWSLVQLFYLDYEWLGVGRVRMCIVVDGVILCAHQFVIGNAINAVHMSTPNLPLRYQLITTADSPVSRLAAICATVISEGGKFDLGVIRCKSTAGTHVPAAVENTLYAIVGIRLKSDHIGAQIELLATSIAEHKGGKHLEWQIVFNGDIAGSPSWADETNSSLQTFLGDGTHIVTGGIVFVGGYFGSAVQGGGTDSAGLPNALRLGSAIDGTVDEIVLAVRAVGGSINADIEASLMWRETP